MCPQAVEVVVEVVVAEAVVGNRVPPPVCNCLAPTVTLQVAATVLAATATLLPVAAPPLLAVEAAAVEAPSATKTLSATMVSAATTSGNAYDAMLNQWLRRRKELC